MYCMCLENDYLSIVKKQLHSSWTKNKNFSKEWMLDNTLENISEKNPFYGEYTFYYWYWKNLLKEKKSDEWVGFCSYRELWGEHKNIKNKNSIKSLLKSLPNEWDNYDAIIGEPTLLDRPKWMKLIKHGKIAMIRNYKEILNQNLVDFEDMYHGGNQIGQ